MAPSTRLDASITLARESVHAPSRLLLRSSARHRRPCRRRHVDLRQLPLRQGEAAVRRGHRLCLARPRPRGLGAALGLLGLVRLARGPDPHQPPLHHRLPRRELLQRKEPARRRLRRPRPQGRDPLPHAGGRCADGHGGRDRQGRSRHARARRARGQRGAQARPDGPRAGLREGHRPQVPVGRALQRRPAVHLPLQALHRHPSRVRAGGRHRGLRRRSRQLPVPALVPGHGPAARLRGAASR